MEDEELYLPRATVANFVKRQLPKSIRCSADCRDLFVQCATEFIQLVSSEATELCNQKNKSKINGEYVCAALEALDMKEYIPEMKAVADELIDGQKKRRNAAKKRKSNKSVEELRREQEALFARAREKTGTNTNP